MNNHRLLYLLALLPLLFFTCEESEEQKPKIQIQTTTGSGWKSQEFEVDIQLQSKTFLRTLTVSSIPEGINYDTTFTSNIKQCSFSLTFTIPNSVVHGDILEIHFDITDENYSNTSMIKIDIVETAGDIYTHLQIILGGMQHELGAFISLADASIYSEQQAAANYSKIDLVYVFSSDFGSALFSTHYPGLDSISGYDFSGWQNYNQTKLLKLTDQLPDGFNFDNQETDSEIVPLAVDADQRVIINLEENDLIAFITARNKSGIFRVNEIQPGSDGFIDISVKIQQ